MNTTHLRSNSPTGKTKKYNFWRQEEKNNNNSISLVEIQQKKKKVSSENIQPCHKSTRRSWFRICHVGLWHLCCCFLLKLRDLQTFFSLWLCVYISEWEKKERKGKRGQGRWGREGRGGVFRLLQRKTVSCWRLLQRQMVQMSTVGGAHGWCCWLGRAVHAAEQVSKLGYVSLSPGLAN